MADELLHATSLRVVGLPGFELRVMGEEQFGQVLRALSVVLGAAGTTMSQRLIQASRRSGVATYLTAIAPKTNPQR